MFGFLLAIAAPDPKPLVIDVGAELYPAEALAAKLAGDVPVKLSVAADGALRCVASPGGALAALKRPSCELIAARDIFPPLVEKGKVFATEYSVIVRWNPAAHNAQFGGALPVNRANWIRRTDYPPIAAHNVITGKVRIVFEITPGGRAEKCRIDDTNATLALSGAMCPLLVERAVFLPALGPDGKPKRTTGWFNTEWQWCGDGKCAAPDTGE